MDVKQIPIDQIFIPPIQHRRVDPESLAFDGLVNSLKEWGQKQPVGVIKGKKNEDDQPYVLTFGFHRIAAAKKLGWKDISAKLEDPSITDANIQLIQLQENLARVNPKPRETAEHLLRIIDSDEYLGVDLPTILAKVGINLSTHQVNQFLKLTKLVPEAAVILDQGRMPVNNARVLATFPADKQMDFVKYAMEMKFSEFKPKAEAELEKFRIKAGKTPKPVNRWQGSSFQKAKDIQSMITELENGKDVFHKDYPVDLTKSKDYNPRMAIEGALMGLRWCIKMDPVNVAERKAKLEETAAQRDAKKQLNNANIAKIRKLQSDPAKAKELNDLLASIA